MVTLPDCHSERRIPASIEVTAQQALESTDLPNLFPQGERVYIPDLGSTNAETAARAARRLKDLGYEPVPHLASRRVKTKAVLEDRIARLAQDAGVSDVLIIGGGLAKPAGDLRSSLDILETGILDRYGIKNIGIAGHPETNPDFSEEVAIEALRLKHVFAERTGARMRIITQFGFDPERSIEWATALEGYGIDLPVHLGVAGPAKLTTLVKYAAMCGVGNSIDFLKKRALSLSALALNQSPDTVVDPIEGHWLGNANSAIKQIHVFPFGGIQKTTDWLKVRGSWK